MNINPKRLFFLLLIASVSVSAVIGILLVLFGEFGEIESKILGTSLTITFMSLLGLTCGASLEAKRLKIVPLAGIVLSIFSAAVVIAIIWSERSDGEWIAKSVISTTVLACAASYVSLMAFATLSGGYRWAQTAVYIAVAMLVGLILWETWIEFDSEELMLRVIGADSILIGALTIIIPIFHGLSGGDDKVNTLDREIEALKAKLLDLEAKREGIKTKEANSE